MKEKIQIVVVCGFLNSGKTTLMNDMAKRSKEEELSSFCILFEEGEEELDDSLCDYSTVVEREELEHLDKLSEKLYQEVVKRECDRVLVEWNGMFDFSLVCSLFMSKEWKAVAKIEQVVYVADVDEAPMWIGQTGEEPITQIRDADSFFLISKNGVNTKKERDLRHGLKTMNPHAKCFTELERLYEEAWKPKSTAEASFLKVFAIIMLYIFTAPYFEELGLPLNTWLSVFAGIMLEGIPFLLIGTFLSALIQILLPEGYLERIYPKNTLVGILVAGLSGFFLPICDCAVVPVMRGLVKKGVPFGAAVTFMVITPIVNPISLLSTYYAFNCNIRVVAIRAGLGILAGVIIGLILSVRKGNVMMKRNAYAGICQSCQLSRQAVTKKEKAFAVLKQTQDEFYAVGKYLVIGGAISTTIHIFSQQFQKLGSNAPIPFLILIFLVFAFFVSMCSNSDAVVARSLLNQFPEAPILGFLIFGPMMDVKNYLMLREEFDKKTVMRMVLWIAMICYSVVLLFYLCGGRLMA